MHFSEEANYGFYSFVFLCDNIIIHTVIKMNKNTYKNKILFTLKENNFQLLFLGQTKHIVKPRHCYTYALLSQHHNIILNVTFFQQFAYDYLQCRYNNVEVSQCVLFDREKTIGNCFPLR